MLKEEMEKQLGVKVSMTFYVTANGMYVQGPYKNNMEFCEMLKQDKLLMQSLREQELIRKQVSECYFKIMHIIENFHHALSNIL